MYCITDVEVAKRRLVQTSTVVTIKETKLYNKYLNVIFQTVTLLRTMTRTMTRTLTATQRILLLA